MINRANEGTDVLGDLVKRPQETERGYDPRQWQDAASGNGKNKVLLHGAGTDVVELVEPQPPVPRMIELPGSMAEDRPVLQKFFGENPDLVPHGAAIEKEVLQIRQDAPKFGVSEVFNLAVARICKANNLPLVREAPMPAPLEESAAKIQSAEVKRLEAEAKKVRTPVGQDWRALRIAIRETTPKPKGKR